MAWWRPLPSIDGTPSVSRDAPVQGMFTVPSGWSSGEAGGAPALERVWCERPPERSAECDEMLRAARHHATDGAQQLELPDAPPHVLIAGQEPRFQLAELRERMVAPAAAQARQVPVHVHADGPVARADGEALQRTLHRRRVLALVRGEAL